MELTVDGERVRVDAEDEMPLLWVLRDVLGKTGTKYGCGIALCGACTVHLDGRPARSCQVTAGELDGVEITTIEGLGAPEALHAVQKAWIDHQVAQCGYCQAGQIMSAAAMLAKDPSPTDEHIDRVMSANLCRCGTYPRIRQAIKAASAALSEKAP